MAKKSNKSRAVLIGVILGLAASGGRLFSAVRRRRTPEALNAGGTRHDLSRQPAGRDLHGNQHGDLGGVPPMQDADSLLMGGSSANDDAGNLASASAYSSERGPYDADISAEGVTLTYADPTDRGGDVPLDEGIPNLGEPGDVEDVRPETDAEEASVEAVESGVPEEFGEDEAIDSIEFDDAWVADAPGEENEIPAASRGLREYGEGDEDERDIEDADDTGSLGLFEDVEPSGAGGEVDLENDEASQGANEGFSIVEDPNDPVSADEGGTMIDPLSPEETLGLRDSESYDAPDDTGRSAARSNLGVTGDFEDAVTTQRIVAAAGEADTSGDEGEDRQASFATGGREHEGVRDSGADRDTGEHSFGETGEFGVPAPEEAGPDIETDETQHTVGSTGEPTDAGRERAGAEERDAPDGGATPDDREHLGVSGDFEEAGSTEKVPAQPADDETTSERSDRESYVTGDDEGQQASAGGDSAGYSAAWSTPAGVVGEWPDQEDGPKGFPGEREGGEADARQQAADTSDTTGGKSAGESGQITSEAKDRAGMEMTSSGDTGTNDQDSAAADDYSGVHSGEESTDLAAASAGDLGAATSVMGGVRREDDAGDSSVNPASGGAEDPATSNAPDSDRQNTPHKSRKQRRMEATDWLPAGAVKGDGTATCPADYPIKGNANSRIYHRPEDPSYPPTIPEFCFATEDDAKNAGFRAPKG